MNYTTEIRIKTAIVIGACIIVGWACVVLVNSKPSNKLTRADMLIGEVQSDMTGLIETQLAIQKDVENRLQKMEVNMEVVRESLRIQERRIDAMFFESIGKIKEDSQ